LKNSGIYTRIPLLLLYLPKVSTRLESLTFQALNSLDVKRRVILSGTPIQVLVCDQVMHIHLLTREKFLPE